MLDHNAGTARHLGAMIGLVIGVAALASTAAAQQTPTPAAPSPLTKSVSAPSDRGKSRPAPDVDGTYTIEGRTGEIRVHRIGGDCLLLSSSEGWEGVGILDHAQYRGVFRVREGPAPADVIFGLHVIDWSRLDAPEVRVEYSVDPPKNRTERWQRVAEGAKGGAPTPRPAAAPSPGGRPALGEYVYVEELPEAFTKVPPNGPPGLEGTVLMQALVLEDGSIGDVKVMKSIPGLDEPAVAALRQWRFKPARTAGKPVAVWVSVPMKFDGR